MLFSHSFVFFVFSLLNLVDVTDEAAAQREEESLLPNKLHCEAAMNVQETRGQTSRKPEKSV